MKLLIVDDETIIRDGIKAIISRMQSINLEIYEADNGKTALEIVRNDCPDIILLDIRMPYMDGLEFMQRYAETNQHGKVIILSGYGDFEYTREAIRFGAVDYLLKPVKRENLCSTLEKAAQEIIQSKNEVEEQHAAMQSYIISEKLYRLILDRRKNAKPLAQLLKDHNLSFRGDRYRVLYAHIEKETAVQTNDPVGILLAELKRAFSTMLCAELTTNEAFAIIDDAVFPRPALQRQTEALLQKLTGMGMRVVFGIGESVNLDTAPVRSAYTKAQRASLERFLYPRQTCFFYEEIQKAAIPWLSEKDYASLRYRMQQQDKEGIRQAVLRLFQRFSGEGYSVYSFVECLGASLLEVIPQNKDNLQQPLNFATLSLFWDTVTQCETLDDIAAIYAETLSEFYPAQNQDALHNKTIQLAKKYIDNHYREDLTLAKVAEHVGMSAAYFSVLFKKENHCGLVEYINDIRIEHAAALLKDPQCRIYEVAIRVGFTDDKYFSRVFKKKMGVSPSEYRRKC